MCTCVYANPFLQYSACADYMAGLADGLWSAQVGKDGIGNQLGLKCILNILMVHVNVCADIAAAVVWYIVVGRELGGMAFLVPRIMR